MRTAGPVGHAAHSPMQQQLAPAPLSMEVPMGLQAALAQLEAAQPAAATSTAGAHGSCTCAAAGT